MDEYSSTSTEMAGSREVVDERRMCVRRMLATLSHAVWGKGESSGRKDYHKGEREENKGVVRDTESESESVGWKGGRVLTMMACRARASLQLSERGTNFSVIAVCGDIQIANLIG